MSNTNNVNGISGRFACVHGGIRTAEQSHGDESKAWGAAIADAPEDATAWLVLADWLEEEGNPAHHVIRVPFTPGYEPPAGFKGEMSRSGRYHESGSQYDEGFRLSWGEDSDHHDYRGFTHHYWSNGSFRSPITREQAVNGITRKGGRNVSTWASMTVAGAVPPAYRIIPHGTEVIVTKAGETKARTHTTTTTIRIPAEARNYYVTWGGLCTYGYEFDYMGYTVVVLTRNVQSVA